MKTSLLLGPEHGHLILRSCLTPDDVRRFEQKFDRGPESECWLWKNMLFEHGYGRFQIVRKKYTFAHRVAYALAHGEVPAGKVVRHSCDVRRCVNPAHLSLGTQIDNLADAFKKGHYKRPRPQRQRLTPEDVLAIVQSTERVRVIARRYDISEGYVREIRAGRARRYVDRGAERRSA